MKIFIPSGKYVIAVSGGVDSVVLLDLLANEGVEMVVAHYNHGIRPDSDKDEEFVRKLAEEYKLPFEVERGNLGVKASEETAREARYKFLNKLKLKYRANNIITAHQQDDLIETVIINILRGSCRRGLSAIVENPNVLRPLLNYSKKQIVNYAKKNHLKWREDPSNKDIKYLRNFIRHEIMPRLTNTQRNQIRRGVVESVEINQLINQEIAKLLQITVKNNQIDRSDFISLPDDVSKEVLMAYLRQNSLNSYDKKTIDRLVIAIKTAKAGTKSNVLKGFYIQINNKNAHLTTSVKA